MFTMDEFLASQDTAVPIPRSLNGTGDQTYAHQLGINVEGIVSGLLLNDASIQCLDVGGFHGKALQDIGRYIREKVVGNPVTLTLIDLPDREDLHRDSEVHFFGGDLEDDGFLDRIARELPKQRIIFMNQVTQYLRDRLGVIKLLFDSFLQVGGDFYVNIPSGLFIHGNKLDESIILSALYEEWKKKGIQYTVSPIQFGKRMLYRFHFSKNSEDQRLPVPAYKYSQTVAITKDLIFQATAYNFAEIRE